MGIMGRAGTVSQSEGGLNLSLARCRLGDIDEYDPRISRRRRFGRQTGSSWLDVDEVFGRSINTAERFGWGSGIDGTARAHDGHPQPEDMQITPRARSETPCF